MKLTNQTPKYVPGEVLLRLKNSGNTLSGDVLSEYGSNIVERFELSEPSLSSTESNDIVRVKLPQGVDVNDALAQMKQDERIAFAEPNYLYQLPEFQATEPTTLPNDLTSKLWGLHNEGQTGGKPGADINAPEAWQITQGDNSPNGPLIAVIDTGIDYTHPDLAANMWTNPGEIPGDGIDNDGNGVIDDVHGYNAFAQTGDPMDGHSHGTHCAGTIGAVGDNGIGVVGVSPKAKLMGVKIFSDKGESTSASILRGILYANKMGADITSNSWGGGPYNEAVKEAFAASEALHVVAAGNDKVDNDTIDYYPANYDVDNMIVVAATDHRDERAAFSQWGASNVDVAAPGKDIYSTVPNGKYASYSGTSMATPHVSGVAALVASQYPDATAQQIKDRLIYGSDKVHDLTDISVSDGRVNAAASLENDTIAPGAPQQIQIEDLNYRGAALSWLTPGDDGDQGAPVSTVEIRMSEKPITEENFRDAKPFLTGSENALNERHGYAIQETPSLKERQVYFSVQAVDNAGNRSPLVSTDQVTLPKAELLFNEDFTSSRTSFEIDGDFRSFKDPIKGQVFTSAPPRGSRAKSTSTLTSPRINLSKHENPFLQFEMSADLAIANTAELEVTTDGRRWNRLERIENSDGWKTHGLDLSDYEGKTVQLRFSVNSRIGRAKNGISLSNLQVFGQADKE